MRVEHTTKKTEQKAIMKWSLRLRASLYEWEMKNLAASVKFWGSRPSRSINSDSETLHDRQEEGRLTGDALIVSQRP